MSVSGFSLPASVDLPACPAELLPAKQRPTQAKKEPAIIKDSLLYTELQPLQVSKLYQRVMRDAKKYKRTGCVLSTLPLDHKGGYPKSLRLTKRDGPAPRPPTFSYNAAAVVLIHADKKPKLSSDEASHLCEHPWCVQADHLLWESRTGNGKRKNCNTRVDCGCCGSRLNPCKHQPKCLDMGDCECVFHQK